MRRPAFTRQFERDVRRAEKRGKDTEKLKRVLAALIAEESLAPRRATTSWSTTIRAAASATSSRTGC